MSQQIQITGGAKVRDLQDVIIGSSGVLSSLAFDVANGVPKLDSNGKILVSQLPNSVMEYKGTWDAATNTPTLANGTGNQGDVYLCNVAGTVDFGAGAIAFVVSDQAIYSGSIWQKASGSNGTVTSVAITESGDSLNITGSPITTSGTINIGFNGTNLQYVNGAGNLTTFPILTGFVPYTGATANVDLGGFNITAGGITAGGTSSFVAATLTSNLWLKNTGSYDFIISNNTSLTTNVVKAYYTTNDELRFYAKNTAGASVVPKIMVGDGATFTQLQSTITLTTTGTSGAATLVGATLNIPQYQAAGTYVTSVTASAPLSSSGSTNPNITITQVSSTVDGYLSFSDYNVFSGKISGSGTAGYITRYTGSGSTIGNSGLYDDGTTVSLISRALSGSSASFGSSVTATSFVKTSGTSSQYLMADGSVSTLTNPVTGTGTTNYLPKFTGTSTIGNSQVSDDGTNVTISSTDLNSLFVTNPTTSGATTGSGIGFKAYNGTSVAQSAGIFLTANSWSYGTYSANQLSIGADGTGGIALRTANSASIAFFTGGASAGVSTQKMILNSSGNLGLGVTPSAWRSTERALQIGATTSVTDISNFAVFRNNNYVNSSGQEIYITTNGASALVLAPTSEYRFLQAAAGTAGNIISFTQAMTLTAAGNLGIGTASPSAILDSQTNSGAGNILNSAADVVARFGNINTNPGNHYGSGLQVYQGTGTLGSGYAVGFLNVSNNSATPQNTNTLALIAPSGMSGGLRFYAADSSADIRYYTANTERMRITSGGNVLIGTSTDDGGRLTIKAAGNTSSDYAIVVRSSTADLFYARGDGYLNTGLQSNSPYYYNTTYSPRSCSLDLGGGIGYVVSTRESKGNIESIKNIDFINQLNPVQFNYRKKNVNNSDFIDELYEDVYYGFIADEVEKVNKDLVFYDNLQDGTKKLSGVEYNSMIAILTKAIQEQQKQIEELKLKIK
jgi:hypothetical protein